MISIKDVKVPHHGEIIQAADTINICRLAGRYELADRVGAEQEELEPWLFDGCSKWYQQWEGKPIYKACFFHDVAYFVGGVGYLRLIADAQLMIDIATLLEDSEMALIMFTGVRAGGSGEWRREFSWGFGKFKEEGNG